MMPLTVTENECFPPRRPFASGQEGSALVELALVLPIFVLLLGGTMDIGQAWFLKTTLSSAAEAGALYGVQVPGDAAGMQAAAASEVQASWNASTRAVLGTECADGTEATTNANFAHTCSEVKPYVEVTVSALFSPVLPVPGLPAQTFAVMCHMRTAN